tara:strand:- start:1814 stop:2029 length:216 start_codon:yes stop_codon:yes gene_type:complete
MKTIKEISKDLKPIPRKFYHSMALDICEIFNDKIKYLEIKGWDTTNYILMKNKALEKLDKNIEIFYEKNIR